MANRIVHHSINIITLDAGERLAEHGRCGDIVLVQDDAGWWVNFIDEDGRADGYDAPFASHQKALWTAKAAAEFAAE